METSAVSRDPSSRAHHSNEGDPPQSKPHGHRVERRWLSHRRANGTAKELGEPRRREKRSWSSYHHRDRTRGPNDDHEDVGARDEPGGEERWLSRRHGQEVSNDASSAHAEDRSLLHRQGSRALQGGRVLRNRRYRRPFDDHRHTKRLFTPEIKKYLKDWLVRRRDHPYPNRDEKKRLAVQTGLTYIQICNWFANWRRKLKNAGDEQRTTWGHLIKSYNTQAQGNVEQFSICSDDSIWEQQALNEPVDGDEEQGVPTLTYATNTAAMDHSYSVVPNKSDESNVEGLPQEAISASENQPQCFQVTSTTTEEEDAHIMAPASEHILQQEHTVATCGSSKYKSHVMAPASEHILQQEHTVATCGSSKYKSHVMAPTSAHILQQEHTVATCGSSKHKSHIMAPASAHILQQEHTVATCGSSKYKSHVMAPASEHILQQEHTVATCGSSKHKSHLMAPASAHILQQEHTVATCGSSKYKSHIMEKYLRDLRLGPSQSDYANALYKKDEASQKWTHSKEYDNGNVNSERGNESTPNSSTPAIWEDPARGGERKIRQEKKKRSVKKTKETCPPMVLSKWLESAAKFQPTKSYVPWTVSKKDAWHPPRGNSNNKKTPRQNVTENGAPALSNMADMLWASQGHHREELDAAEALTRLSGLQH